MCSIKEQVAAQWQHGALYCKIVDYNAHIKSDFADNGRDMRTVATVEGSAVKIDLIQDERGNYSPHVQQDSCLEARPREKLLLRTN